MKEADLIGMGYPEMLGLILPPTEPTPISMWPETQAWIWLGVLACALLGYAAFRWHRYRKLNAYRRAAVSALSEVGNDATAIATILRRTALAAYPRSLVAGLHGEDWLRFLDKTWGRPGFESDMGRKMLSAPYRSDQLILDGLNDLACDWVRHHNAEVRT